MQAKHPTNKVALLGKIFTSDLSNKWAEALVYEGNTIIYVGDRDGAKNYMDASCEVHEFNDGQLILPGFIDSHMHPFQAGIQFRNCPVDDCKNVEDVQNTIKKRIEDHPEKEWIFCSGYADPMFPDNKPHKKYLDEICSDKPISIYRLDGHGYLINSKAMEIAEITKDTEDPSFGEIEKGEDGEPTGVLTEGAMDLVKNKFPKRDKEDLHKGLKLGLKKLLCEGITTFANALTRPYMRPTFEEAYSQYDDILPRAVLYIEWDKEIQEILEKNPDEDFDFAKALDFTPHDKLRVGTVKFLVDGVLESKTALLEEPYCGEKEHHGTSNFTAEKLKYFVGMLYKKGVQCHFHTIGDLAVKWCLDAVEHARSQDPDNADGKDLRPCLAHLQVVKDRDIKRFKPLGALANFSPFWFSYTENEEETDRLIGPERAKKQYPIRDIMNEGVTICFGSDWPVTSRRPLDGIEKAVTRKEAGDNNPKSEPWCPEQSVKVEEAVLGYTINSAYAVHQEKTTGSLEVGKRADVVVVSHNIFECETWKISQAEVKLAIVDGKVLFDRAKDGEEMEE